MFWEKLIFFIVRFIWWWAIVFTLNCASPAQYLDRRRGDVIRICSYKSRDSWNSRKNIELAQEESKNKPISRRKTAVEKWGQRCGLSTLQPIKCACEPKKGVARSSNQKLRYWNFLPTAFLNGKLLPCFHCEFCWSFLAKSLGFFFISHHPIFFTCQHKVPGIAASPRRPAKAWSPTRTSLRNWQVRHFSALYKQSSPFMQDGNPSIYPTIIHRIFPHIWTRKTMRQRLLRCLMSHFFHLPRTYLWITHRFYMSQPSSARISSRNHVKLAKLGWAIHLDLLCFVLSIPLFPEENHCLGLIFFWALVFTPGKHILLPSCWIEKSFSLCNRNSWQWTTNLFAVYRHRSPESGRMLCSPVQVFLVAIP